MELHATLSVRVRVGECGESFVPVGLEAGIARRVLFRFGLEVGVAGRILYRGCALRGWWVVVCGKSSPCSGSLRPGRDYFLLARVKRAEMGVFCCAGRVLYRFGLEVGVAGRVLYRGVCAAWVVGGGLREKIRPAGSARVANAKFFAQRAQDRPKRAIFAVLGEFFAVCAWAGFCWACCVAG